MKDQKNKMTSQQNEHWQTSLTEDGRLRLVPVESLGQILSTAQRDARERWLGSKSGF